eukprot:5103392-Alexandrium_andersonii.AAC.1
MQLQATLGAIGRKRPMAPKARAPNSAQSRLELHNHRMILHCAALSSFRRDCPVQSRGRR